MTIKIADKNWVLTACDELSADGVNSAINATNQGKAALTTGNSADKGTAKISTEQGNGMKFRVTEKELEIIDETLTEQRTLLS